jgi:hypothetical protein
MRGCVLGAKVVINPAGLIDEDVRANPILELALERQNVEETTTYSLKKNYS